MTTNKQIIGMKTQMTNEIILKTEAVYENENIDILTVIDNTELEIMEQELENAAVDNEEINDLLDLELSGLFPKIKETDVLPSRSNDGLKEDINTYHCPNCKYSTANLRYYKNHFYFHSKEKICCDKCDYSTKKKRDLVKHKLKHSSEDNSLKCKYCDFKTLYKGSMRAHTLLHLKPKMLVCDVCMKTYTSDKGLQFHMYQHTGLEDIPYACTYDGCRFRAFKPSALNTHIQSVHLKVMLYKCEYCKYGTSRKGDMKTHINFKHKCERNHPCSQCSYIGYSKGHLNRHLATHVSKIHVCETCGVEFQRKLLLTNHIKKAHIQETTNDEEDESN